jgi:hypothetical protein
VEAPLVGFPWFTTRWAKRKKPKRTLAATGKAPHSGDWIAPFPSATANSRRSKAIAAILGIHEKDALVIGLGSGPVATKSPRTNYSRWPLYWDKYGPCTEVTR